MLKQPGDEKALVEYCDALAAVLTSPQVCDSIVGDAPTVRTREIAQVLREGAEQVAADSEKWDLYLTKQDFKAKAEAATARSEFAALSDRASHLFQALRSAYGS